MKIYFTFSTAKFLKYKKTYFKIREFLLKEGHVLTRDWIPETERLILNGDKEIKDIKVIYKECLEAIRDADITIIDDTVSNFSTGHQITISLQSKKPTLVLWKGTKHRQFNQMFIHGIDSDILQVSEYNNENYKDIVRSFIRKYEKVHERHRFHLVLDNMERNYLDWAQYVKNRSRTKVIRDALRKEIEGDEEYEKYMKTK